MSICAIVAVDENWGIGYKGELLVSLPEDQKNNFKVKTMGHPVIFGRKTLDTRSKRFWNILKEARKSAFTLLVERRSTSSSCRIVTLVLFRRSTELLRQMRFFRILTISKSGNCTAESPLFIP